MKTRLLILLLICCFHTSIRAEDLCKIKLVDESNGWPVPLVELKTTNNVRFHSDNAGVIAFDLPELMGVPTWFSIEGHGYNVKPDGFGIRGIRLTPEPGQTLTVKVQRELPAKRLGRITGGGLFGEAQRFGEFVDWKDQGILGCDSVQITVHNGKMFWAWGDTTLPGYPLGLFHMLGATTKTLPLESFEPPVQLRYDYFRDAKGKPRVIAKMPGPGPTWLNGFFNFYAQNGQQKLGATYTKIEPPLSPYEVGLCLWDDDAKNFEQYKVLWKKSKQSPKPPVVPEGHPVTWFDDKGKAWLLFGDPFPRVKFPASLEDWSQPESWEILEPQRRVARRDGGEPITPHRGSISWNVYRQKWVTVFCEIGGDPSPLGELWYAEADEPTGPWGPAVKVVTHNNYSFYNPLLHPDFTRPESPILLFEATYTSTFANQPYPTPRHDYNQVLYRLDLDDPALKIE